MQINEDDAWICASNPKAALPCVLSHASDGRIAFYALDPLQGKTKRLAEIQYAPIAQIRGWNVSPDGSQIALLDHDPQGTRIVIIATSDGGTKQIDVEPSAGTPMSVSWATDGKGFYVSSRGTNLIELLYVTRAGKARTLWRTDKNPAGAFPIPSPDGKHLAFGGLSLDSNVWIIDNF